MLINKEMNNAYRRPLPTIASKRNRIIKDVKKVVVFSGATYH